jgi:hypothetical protein
MRSSCARPSITLAANRDDITLDTVEVREVVASA